MEVPHRRSRAVARLGPGGPRRRLPPVLLHERRGHHVDRDRPENPAARIAVFEKGKEIFAGWIFTRFPDVHPFTAPPLLAPARGGRPPGRPP